MKTRNSKIRALIVRNQKKAPTIEEALPKYHGANGRNERRADEIKRLKSALTGVAKKPRMRRWAHKK